MSPSNPAAHASAAADEVLRSYTCSCPSIDRQLGRRGHVCGWRSNDSGASEGHCGVIVPCRDAERRVWQAIELARRSQPRLRKHQPIETKQDNQTVSCHRWVGAR